MRPQPRVQNKKSTRASHHGHTGNTRHSPRNGFNGYFGLSPVIGLFCHRHRRNYFRQLDAGVEASGPHDFAVRLSALRLCAPSASTASRLASVTIASRPSVRRDGSGYIADLGEARSEIFSKKDWTTGQLTHVVCS
jgi:hypothetical protein